MHAISKRPLLSGPALPRPVLRSRLRRSEPRRRRGTACLDRASAFAAAFTRVLPISLLLTTATAQSVLTPSPWTFEPNQLNAQLSSIRSAGDINNDGFTDVIASAPLFDGQNPDSGRVWLFLGSNTGLATTPSWTSSGPDRPNAHFGEQISSAGDTDNDGFDDILISVPNLSNGQPGEGAAFLYRGTPTGLTPTPSWIFEGNQPGLQVTSVTTAGDVNRDGFADILVGATDPANTGRVFLFYGRPTGPSTTPSWTIDGAQLGAQPGALFGSRVTNAGDVDSDGFADFLVAAASYNGGAGIEGRVWLFRGTATLPSTTPAWSWGGSESGAGVGAFDNLGAAGDVDGDGFADVIVGASGIGFDDHGVVWLFRGSSTGLSTLPTSTIVGAQSFARFGQAASAAGDVDGDGRADVWIGSPFWSGAGGTTGRIELHRGRASGLVSTPDFVVDVATLGAADQSQLGAQVSSVGDVNGDGFADVVSVAPRFDAGEVDEGKAWLFTGRARGLKTTHDWVFERDKSEFLGASVASRGDINGDGFDDIVAGAPGLLGKVYVFYGRAGTPSTLPNLSIGPSQLDAGFGASVAHAGDVNGDGFGDVVVGAPYFDQVGADKGAVLLYLGGSSGLSTSPYRTIVGDQALAHFGWSVAGAGDVDGDGLADVIVGARDYAGGGRVFVYLGSVTDPLGTLGWSVQGSGLRLGENVSSAGDVDGDGISDVLACDHDHAYLWRGPLHGTSQTPSWSATATIFTFPDAVASTAGDVNGDGYDDVITSRPPRVFLGSLAGLSTTPAWTIPSVNEMVVASAGDVNGDGFSDIAIGDPEFEGIFGLGRAWVYLGSASGPALNSHWYVEGYPGSIHFDVDFGSAFGAGDVDGDGISDLVVGAHSQGSEDQAFSRVFLFRGNVDGGPPYAAKQRRGDDASVLEPLSRSGAPDAFRVSTFPATASFVPGTIAGRMRAHLEYEVEPLGTPFDGAGLRRSAVVDVGAPGPGAPFNVPCDGLQPGTAYHWRARIATDDPVLAHSRWISAPVLCRTEAMVRTSRDCNSNLIADETDIENGTSADTNGDGLPDECQGTGTGYCFGDGSGTNCPCGNFGSAGNGCANSANPAGAHLATSGVAAVSHDTLVLQGSGMTPGSSGLYFQGTTLTNGGAGGPFGDGLRCTGGTVVRLGIKANVNGASSYPSGPNDLPIAQKGLIPAGGGVTRRYQLWFRDAVPFCMSSTFNLTNGVSVTWTP